MKEDELESIDFELEKPPRMMFTPVFAQMEKAVYSDLLTQWFADFIRYSHQQSLQLAAQAASGSASAAVLSKLRLPYGLSKNETDKILENEQREGNNPSNFLMDPFDLKKDRSEKINQQSIFGKDPSVEKAERLLGVDLENIHHHQLTQSIKHISRDQRSFVPMPDRKAAKKALLMLGRDPTKEKVAKLLGDEKALDKAKEEEMKQNIIQIDLMYAVEKLLQTREGNLQLSEYLKKEKKDHYSMFWGDVEVYRNLIRADNRVRLEYATEIFSKYIRAGSPYNIKFSSEIK